MSREKLSQELAELLEELCLGNLSTEQAARLEGILQADPEQCRHYIRFVQMHAIAERCEATSPPCDDTVPPIAAPSASQANAAKSSVVLSPTPPFALPSKSPVLGFLASISRHVPGGEFTVGGLLLLVIVAAFWGLSQAILFPRLGGPDLAHDLSPLAPAKGRGAGGEGQSVATIIETDNVEWSANPSAFSLQPSAINAGEPLSIQSGLIELQLASGTTLLIEGPADWTIDGSNNATLKQGKLVAKVPMQAVGFAIETPTAKVVDLGTEFSVEVGKTGETDVRVIRGAVEVDRSITSSFTATSRAKQRLIAGESVRVDRAGLSEVSLVATRQATAIDLADIVAGGDGHMRYRDQGINAGTGQVIYRPESDFSRFGYMYGDGKYVKVENRPFIDGVAIPNPAKTPVQLDSAGHVFENCPLTDGSCYGPIWPGRNLPQAPGNLEITCLYESGNASDKASVLAFVPNKLLTFDLTEIRRANPHTALARFCSLVGLTKYAPPIVSEAKADVWIFVDGKRVFERRGLMRRDGGEQIDVALAETAQFLTLVVTDGGNGVHQDSVFFQAPQIELRPISALGVGVPVEGSGTEKK